MSESENTRRIYTVSEVSSGIKRLLETSLRELCVEGEISGLKISSLGHTYFDLKDETSNIACVLFRGSASKFKTNLENGMLVRASGGITTYDKQSKYQLIVKNLELAGVGPLQIAFEKLKRKLQEEGLFDQERKRPIPALPKKIAVVTSPTGAAIRDILSILRRRYANMHIIIAPVKVQGHGAAEEISAAINDLNAGFPDIDVMLVGRGGGSMEDLWCFNEESVARAIASSRIPVISCVGHETDFTIADFVADMRAPTPSAAAELVVKNKMELASQIAGLEKRLLQGLRVYYENLSGRLGRLTGSRVLSNPLALLERPERRLDEAVEALFRGSADKFDAVRGRFELLSGKLNALSPLFPLKKGYAVVTDARGAAVRDAAVLRPGDTLNLRFYSGAAEAVVADKGGGTSQAPAAGRENRRKKRYGGTDPNQETLW